jgi:methionine synthase II (cobalamin-independent)
MMSISSEYYMRENTRLSDMVFELRQEIKRLKQYESMVHYIANDYIELSYDKAQCQRDDWLKRCRKTISEEPPEWTIFLS